MLRGDGAIEVEGPIRIEYMALSELLRAPRNPKSHDIGLIHQSLGRFGYVEPIAINERTGRIVAGHGRLDTLQQKKALGERPPARVLGKQGEWFVPVLRGVEFESDAEAEAYLLASNQSTIAGGWDESELLKVLADLAEQEDGLEGTGFNEHDVEELLRRVGGGDPAVTQDDEQGALEIADQLQQKWQTGENQRWQVGPHQIYGGDCRAVPEEFFGDNKISMIWCDPPYGVGYANKNEFLNRGDRGNRIQKPILNDHLSGDEVQALFRDALIVARKHCRSGAAIYATVPGGPLYVNFVAALEEAGFAFRHGLVWVKNHFVIGMADYHYRHEPVLYGWLPNGPHRWYGGRDQDSVFEVDKPHVSALHSTMKPVELAARMIANSSRPGDIVYDPFGGSCTSIAAAAQLGRIGYACELDPAYVAVGLERLSNLGLVPRRLE